METEHSPNFCFTLGKGVRLRVGEAQLKRCEFCGALNLVQNAECFVCGWRGSFSRDTHQLRATLHRLLETTPDITPLLFTDTRTLRRIFRRRPWWVRALDAIRWWFEAPRGSKR